MNSKVDIAQSVRFLFIPFNLEEAQAVVNVHFSI